jgi:hypothetical protein
MPVAGHFPNVDDSVSGQPAVLEPVSDQLASKVVVHLLADGLSAPEKPRTIRFSLEAGPMEACGLREGALDLLHDLLRDSDG